MRKHIITLLIIFFGGIVRISAYPEYFVKQISLEEGLSQSTVKCILTDHRGLIWIGTQFGLNCFDREQIKSYYHDKNNPHSLPFDEIDFIEEDALHNLWVGTEYGLALYDRENDLFKQIYHKDRQITSRTCLCVDEGILFFETDRILLYRYTDKQFHEQPMHAPAEFSMHVEDVKMYDQTNGKILLATRWNGVWWYYWHTGDVERVSFIPEKNITEIYVDQTNHIWVAPYGKGVFAYTGEGVLKKQLSTANQLRNDVVLDILEWKDEIWLATDGDGIHIYNKEKDEVRVIEHQSGNTHSLPVNSFRCLYKDPVNNLWAGSIRGGLIGLKEISIQTYKESPFGSTHGLSEKTVTGMYEDTDGIIWLGTDGGGVNRFDPSTRLFRHYPQTKQAKVVSIIPMNENELLLSLFSRGLYIFDKQTGKMREYPIADKEQHTRMFRVGRSAHLHRRNKDSFHIYADSVYIYNQSTRKLTTVTIDEKGPWVSSLHHIYSNNYVSYLMGAYDLFEVNQLQQTMRPLYRSHYSIGIISAVCRDKKGNFWIGSTTGLYHYDSIQDTLKAIDNYRFVGIQTLGFDNRDRLWIGTHNDLYAYNPEDERVAVFGESDGISANEYINKAPLITRSGDLYLAGVMGLVHISKDLPFAEQPDPSINLLEVVLDGERLGLPAENHMVVPWDYTSLHIKMMVLEDDLMRKKLFRYYIRGNQEEVIELPNHVISLYSLPIGSYEIWVSCYKKNGDWSEPVELVKISITPPWWKTEWFICLFIVFLIGTIITVVASFIRRKENKMKWAIKEHEQKTYEEKIRFLINLSHELRTPLTLIYAPLKRLLKNGEVKDADQEKQLTSIFKQTRRIKNLIDMVLDVRKIEKGGETLHIKPHALNEWIRTVVDDFSNELESQERTLLFDLDERIEMVPFDAIKCEVILSNLLMNAIKFSEPSTTITITTRLEGEYARIAICDEGIGLGNTDPSRLFVRFYQGSHSVNGTGIGLSYARMLIELHNGSIHATNNPEKGATFFFTLPLIHQGIPVLEMGAPTSTEAWFCSDQEFIPTPEFSTQKYTAIIVEDEPELRDYLKQSLKPHFKQVYVAEDGVDAGTKIRQNQPDIIISDVMMPRMDGFELCREVKSDIEISHIPVVLLTARTDTESTTQGYKLGADAYIAKPFDMDFLLVILKNQLNNREAVKLRYKDNNQVIAPREETISNADEQFMLKLNHFIQENLENPLLDVNYVADHMAMSRASLYNKLKLLTDVSVGDYINKFRMTRALELLANKDLTIMEISERSGFSNQRYFSTVFKQAYGLTPSQYRQKKEVKK